MGACESSNADGKRKARGRGEGVSNAKRTATKIPKLAKADLDSSRQVEEEEIDQRVEILRRGQKKELQKMIDNYEDDINDYSFGTNKTLLLLEAVIKCPNPAVIDMIMEKGADIDKEEYQTGNTAIFLSALDLKVDFVRNLLKYQPNLHHRNHAKQDIFDYLDFQLFQQRRKIGKEMNEDENEKYNEILNMLKEYAG